MKKTAGILVAALLLAGAQSASAAIDCEMDFSMSGWSAFYKTASGSGTIHCNNGQSLKVKIRTKGGGITFSMKRLVMTWSPSVFVVTGVWSISFWPMLVVCT